LLDGFDSHQVTAIAEFLDRSTDFAYRRAALLRAQTLLASTTRSPRQREAETTTRDEGERAHG
jgi:hypothetical protein